MEAFSRVFFVVGRFVVGIFTEHPELQLCEGLGGCSTQPQGPQTMQGPHFLQMIFVLFLWKSFRLIFIFSVLFFMKLVFLSCFFICHSAGGEGQVGLGVLLNATAHFFFRPGAVSHAHTPCLAGAAAGADGVPLRAPVRCVPQLQRPSEPSAAALGVGDKAAAPELLHGRHRGRRRVGERGHRDGVVARKRGARAGGVAAPEAWIIRKGEIRNGPKFEWQSLARRKCAKLMPRFLKVRNNRKHPEATRTIQQASRSQERRNKGPYRGGRGALWHFNFAWEISRFKVTVKFPMRDSGFSANFSHTSSTHCGLWRGGPHKIQGAPRNFPPRILPPRI